MASILDFVRFRSLLFKLMLTKAQLPVHSGLELDSSGVFDVAFTCYFYENALLCVSTDLMSLVSPLILI